MQRSRKIGNVKAEGNNWIKKKDSVAYYQKKTGG